MSGVYIKHSLVYAVMCNKCVRRHISVVIKTKQLGATERTNPAPLSRTQRIQKALTLAFKISDESRHT